MAKILVVDDSSTVRDEVAGFLKGHGLDVDGGLTAATVWPRCAWTRRSGWSSATSICPIWTV